MANSRQNIRKLIKDGFVIKKPVITHSRVRARRRNEAKRKGRHTGMGKRKGTREARMPTEVIWMRRQRVLRRLLRKYRAAKKIDRELYHSLYMMSKGNLFKNKTVLIEYIHKAKNEKQRQKDIQTKLEAKKARAKSKRESKAKRRQERLEGVAQLAEEAEKIVA